MRAARLLPFLLIIALATTAASGDESVFLGPGGATFQPLEHGEIGVLRDHDNTLTLDQVRAADARGLLVPLHGNLGAGYTRDTYWLRFRVTRDNSDSPRRWWLEILPPYLDDVQLFLVRPDGQVETKKNGDLVPRELRDFDHFALLFYLDLPDGVTTGYLRIRTDSPMTVLATVRRSQELMQSSFGAYLFYGLYSGLLVAVLVFVAINWLLLRESLLLLYLGYLAMLLLYSLTSSGLASQFLFFRSPEIADALFAASSAAMTAFGIAFFARMLDIGTSDPVVRTLVRATVAMAVVTAITAIALPHAILMPWLLYVGLLAILAILPMAIERILHGAPPQRLAGLAFLAYAAFVSMNSLISLGIVPPTRFFLVSAQPGILLHIFLLHAATILRMRTTTREKEGLSRQADAAMFEARHERQQRAERDQLLSMIAHEIRTPIAVIDAAAQSLGLLDENPPPERGARYGKIRRAVRRLNLLLDIALNRAIPDQEAGTGNRECDLIELTCEVVSQFEPQHDQQINTWMAVDAARITGGADLLRFVLLNLLDNAGKYSPPHSSVNIEVAPATRAGRPGYTWLITDQGPGVVESERERIFDKYYRGGEQAAAAGLGLGLYIARQIVTQQGGSLRCIAPPAGQGACFECWLPEAPA